MYIWSGQTGQRFAKLNGAETNGYFGSSVARISDLDGDGHPDFLVGAHGERNGRGRVYAFSGLTFLEIDRRTGSSGAGFGVDVAAIGDVDGDGVEDFAGGAPYRNGNEGRIEILSGSDFSLIRRINGNGGNGAWFGYTVANAGDTNGDGRNEILIGEPQRDTVHLYDVDGNLLRTHQGAVASGVGFTICGAGDVNGDGFDDYFYGAVGKWAGFTNQGPGSSTLLRSGLNGSILHSFMPMGLDDAFGAALAAGPAGTASNQTLILIGSPADGMVNMNQAHGLISGYYR